jgi:hypothetical protein
MQKQDRLLNGPFRILAPGEFASIPKVLFGMGSMGQERLSDSTPKPKRSRNTSCPGRILAHMGLPSMPTTIFGIFLSTKVSLGDWTRTPVVSLDILSPMTILVPLREISTWIPKGGCGLTLAVQTELATFTYETRNDPCLRVNCHSLLTPFWLVDRLKLVRSCRIRSVPLT